MSGDSSPASFGYRSCRSAASSARAPAGDEAPRDAETECLTAARVTVISVVHTVFLATRTKDVPLRGTGEMGRREE